MAVQNNSVAFGYARRHRRRDRAAGRPGLDVRQQRLHPAAAPRAASRGGGGGRA